MKNKFYSWLKRVVERIKKIFKALMELSSTKYQNNTRVVAGTLTVRQNDEVLNCNTSSAPVTVNLLSIPSNHWSTTWELCVFDNSNNAGTNNITIVAPAGFFINGHQSITLNENAGGVLIKVGNDLNYVATYTYCACSALRIQNTVFVAKNGNDSTGIVERLDKPFLTIPAARAAVVAYYTASRLPSATNRICMKVFSGRYLDETIVLFNYLDYDLTDAVIDTTSFAHLAYAVIDNNVACNSIIYGSAPFTGGIFIQNAGSNVTLRCESIINTDADDLVEVFTTGAVLNVYCNAISGRNTPVRTFGGGTLFVQCPSITTAFTTAVFSSAGGNITVNSNNIQNSSNSNATIENDGSGTMTINGARLVNTLNGKCVSRIAGVIIINNCTLITAGTDSANGTIKVYGMCQANKALTSATQQVGVTTVDVNVV